MNRNASLLEDHNLARYTRTDGRLHESCDDEEKTEEVTAQTQERK